MGAFKTWRCFKSGYRHQKYGKRSCQRKIVDFHQLILYQISEDKHFSSAEQIRNEEKSHRTDKR